MARKPDNVFRFRRLKWGEPRRFDVAPKPSLPARPRGSSALDYGVWALLAILAFGVGYWVVGML